MDALFAFPYLLLAIVIAFLLSDKLGQGVVTAAVAITVVYVPQYFRVVRNHVISVREEPYVEAARALGAPRRTIISRYVLQNVIQNVPALATLNAADAILTLAALGFLGYGIQPTDAAEWGYDLQRAIDDAGAGIWWTGLFPGFAIVLLVTGFTLLGEGLNDVINPLIRARRTKPPEIPRRRPRRERRAAGAPGRHRSRAGTERAVSDRPSSTSATSGSGTAPEATPCARSTASSSRSARGRPSAWSASPAAASRRSAAACSACCRTRAAVAGSVDYADRELVGLDAAEMRDLRGPELGLIFQEPMTRLDPLHDDRGPLPGGAARRTCPTSTRTRCAAARSRRSRGWASRRPASASTRTSSPAGCGSGS